jgi:hypothetical protein
MILSRKELKKLIESFISGPKGTMHVPDTDPYEDLDPKIKDKFSRETIQSDDYLRNLATDLDASLKDAPDYDHDDVLAPQTGDELETAMKTFDDPMGQYDHQSGYHGVVDSVIQKVSDEYGFDLGLDVDYRGFHAKFPGRGEQVVITSKKKSYLEDIRDELVDRGHLVVNLKYVDPFGSIKHGIYNKPNGMFGLSTFDKKSPRFDRFK